MLRTHTCGEARASLAGKEVTLAGWVHTRRDHGELTFIDLRDRYGITQVVAHAKENPAAHKALGRARNEWVLRVRGTVRPRPEGTKNPKLPTGDVEVAAAEIEVFNESKTPPFYVNEETEVDENLRWKYRYVDLRRARPLLPDRAMLPRRGPARRSHARAQPAGHRDELRGEAGRDGARRRALHRDLQEVRTETAEAGALAAHDVRGGDAPIRDRPP